MDKYEIVQMRDKRPAIIYNREKKKTNKNAVRIEKRVAELIEEKKIM